MVDLFELFELEGPERRKKRPGERGGIRGLFDRIRGTDTATYDDDRRREYRYRGDDDGDDDRREHHYRNDDDDDRRREYRYRDGDDDDRRYGPRRKKRESNFFDFGGDD